MPLVEGHVAIYVVDMNWKFYTVNTFTFLLKFKISQNLYRQKIQTGIKMSHIMWLTTYRPTPSKNFLP
jgi:hypothetical protein